jgi:hypothetical protein
MRHFALDLQAVSPLAIRADHARDGAETARYIPGTTLAGGLAAAYRQFYPENTSDFEALFLSGQVQYPALYPATFKNADMQKSLTPVFPLPKTLRPASAFRDFVKYFQVKMWKQGHVMAFATICWAGPGFACKSVLALLTLTLCWPLFD